MVAAAAKGRTEAWRNYDPVAEDGARLLAKLDTRQLEAKAFSLEAALALQERYLEELKRETR